MLHIEGLNEELVRLKLHHLREVCASWAMLPDSHVIPSHSPGSIPEHCTTDGRAEVWRGLACLGEEGNSAMDVCIKVVRPEKVHNVGDPRPSWSNALDDVPRDTLRWLRSGSD